MYGIILRNQKKSSHKSLPRKEQKNIEMVILTRISQRSTVTHCKKSSLYTCVNTEAYPVNTSCGNRTNKKDTVYNLKDTQETFGGISTLIFCILYTV